jgi:rhodanese-related sulfurtransferase
VPCSSLGQDVVASSLSDFDQPETEGVDAATPIVNAAVFHKREDGNRMRRHDLVRPLGWVLNLASVALIAYIGGVLLAERFWRPQGTGQDRAFALEYGRQVPISEVDWARNGHTLVMALSTSCHFCSESAPFYRDLLARQARGHWSAVAILPQRTEMALAYFRQNRYVVDNVRSMSLADLGVSATPTLLLVDARGMLEQAWIGQLTRVEEQDVAAHLGIKDLPKRDVGAEVRARQESAVMTTPEMIDAVLRREPVMVLDVRARGLFMKEHIQSAVNIPLDELEARAVHELDPARTILVYCSFSAACAASGQRGVCSTAIEALRGLGFEHLRVIRDRVELLRGSGVATEESNQ